MRREEEIKIAKDRSLKTGVELYPAYYRVKLNAGVLSLSSGRSISQADASYGLKANCITLSRQLSITIPEAKYHLAGNYPKVAHRAHSLGSGLSITQHEVKYGSKSDYITLSRQLSISMPEAKYHFAGDYPNVAHRVHSLGSGLSITQQEVKYGSKADCITLSRQLSITMPGAKYHLVYNYPKCTRVMHVTVKCLIAPESIINAVISTGGLPSPLNPLKGATQSSVGKSDDVCGISPLGVRGNAGFGMTTMHECINALMRECENPEPETGNRSLVTVHWSFVTCNLNPVTQKKDRSWKSEEKSRKLLNKKLLTATKFNKKD